MVPQRGRAYGVGKLLFYLPLQFIQCPMDSFPRGILTGYEPLFNNHFLRILQFCLQVPLGLISKPGHSLFLELGNPSENTSGRDMENVGNLVDRVPGCCNYSLQLNGRLLFLI
jgi:hypothetical protein